MPVPAGGGAIAGVERKRSPGTASGTVILLAFGQTETSAGAHRRGEVASKSGQALKFIHAALPFGSRRAGQTELAVLPFHVVALEEEAGAVAVGRAGFSVPLAERPASGEQTGGRHDDDSKGYTVTLLHSASIRDCALSPAESRNWRTVGCDGRPGMPIHFAWATRGVAARDPATEARRMPV